MGTPTLVHKKRLENLFRSPPLRRFLPVLPPYQVWFITHPLLGAMLLGTIVRLLAAILGIGFHAQNDYFHVLSPALSWLEHPDFSWNQSSLSGAGIRSHLLPRLVWALLYLGRWLGVESPEGQLRFLGIIFGFYSLALIPATYRLSNALLTPRSARMATYFSALHFLIPYAGTKLLIEGVAMVPFIWGVALIAEGMTTPKKTYALKTKYVTLYFFWAGIWVSTACWLRFHIAIAAIALALVIFLLPHNRISFLPNQHGEKFPWAKQDGLKQGKQVLYFALGGGIVVILQGIFDSYTHGTFLAPVLANITKNIVSPAPSSSPFAYVGFWLALTAPPITLWLVPSLWHVARKLPLLSIPWAAFVLAHTLIAHKEERFMLPVVPLFIPMCCAAWHHTRRQWRKQNKHGWRTLYLYGIILHAMLLLITITNVNQGATQSLMTHLRQDTSASAVLSFGPELPAFYLQRPHIALHRQKRPTLKWITKIKKRLEQQNRPLNRVVAFASEQEAAMVMIDFAQLTCTPPVMFKGSWIDNIAYWANPHRNKRRSPVLLWRCQNTPQTPVVRRS